MKEENKMLLVTTILVVTVMIIYTAIKTSIKRKIGFITGQHYPISVLSF